jgi:Zeta toxin
LFKETFEEYGASKDSRNRYNAPVHNSAAVLASEYLRRLISAPGQHEQDTVILLTGIPGAGKTSSVLRGGKLPSKVRAVYEGQLSNPETAIAKVRQVLGAGLEPVIVAVHVKPELALQNTLRRFEEVGRGASIGIMAAIQGGLPESLQVV